MEHNKSKSYYIRIAGIIALTGNAILAAIKLVFAYMSSSLAVMGDGIDSSTDVLIAIVTLVISSVIARPSDREHPWGHGRAETTATMILAFIIFFAGSQLIMQSAGRLLSGNTSHEVSNLAIVAAVISICGKIILAVSQFYFGKIADSEMIKANAQNMKNDIVMSTAVLAGLALSSIFHCPILDPILALLVGAWVIKNAVLLFVELNMELMDGNTDSSLYKKLFDAVASVPGVSNPHRARIRKMASLFDVHLDIEVDPNMTVYDAHELTEQVEDEVRKAIPDIYDIVVHTEPAGSDSHQPKEGFGLTPHNYN